MPPPVLPKVFVGGIGSATAGDLKEFFRDADGVVSAVVARDNLGVSRGFGYVSFRDEACQQAAIAEFHGRELVGREVSVKQYTLGTQGAPRSATPSVGNENSVFVGGLPFTATVEQFREHFASCGEILYAHLMKDKATGRSRGLGKITFKSREARTTAIALLNGSSLDGRVIVVRNFTDEPPPAPEVAPTPAARQTPSRSSSVTGKGRAARGDEHAVFCGGLHPDTTAESLREHLSSTGQVEDVQIAMNQLSGISRGFAKAVFATKQAREEAVRLLHLSRLDGRSISVTEYRAGTSFNKSISSAEVGHARPNHSAVFVGGLSVSSSEEDIRQHFEACGEIVRVNVMRDRDTGESKGCGKVIFSTAAEQMKAIDEFDGSRLDGNILSVREFISKPSLPKVQPGAYGSAAPAPRSASTPARRSGTSGDTASSRLKPQPAAPRPKPIEFKVDPDDGAVYTFEAFRAKKSGSVSDREIEDYWRFDCTPAPAGARPSQARLAGDARPQVEERRLDPDDGQLYTFREFTAKCGHEFTASELKEYWELDMERLSTAPVSESVSTLHPSASSTVSTDRLSTSQPSAASSTSASQVHQVNNASHGTRTQNAATEGERRVDPEDGKAYTLKDFEIRCQSEGFSASEIREYWEHEMTVVRMASPNAQATEAAKSGPSVEPYAKFRSLTLRDWLEALDEHMLIFLPQLEERFGSVGQVLSQFCKVGPKGVNELSEAFFKEIGMSKLAHKKLINKWVSAHT